MQIFEKTIAGMYLGEIARRVLLAMAEFSPLFGKSIPEKLLKHFTLRYRFKLILPSFICPRDDIILTEHVECVCMYVCMN